MDSKQSTNRISSEINQWQAREERLSKLFSFSVSDNKALLMEKLRFYERVVSRYKNSDIPDERLALRILRQERNHIEKKLYPDVLGRLLRKLFVILVRMPKEIRNDLRRTQHNYSMLDEKLRRVGFSGLSDKVKAFIKEGKPQFSISNSSYLNEKERMDSQLNFTKNQQGDYQFEGYRSTLVNETNVGDKKQHYFDILIGDITNVSEAYNLLSGRAVQKNDTWIQFDLNDKDQNDNYRIKEFHSSYAYNLEKVIDSLALEIKGFKLNEIVIDSLKEGNRVPIIIIKDGKERQYSIEANPQFKSVTMYDEGLKKINLHDFLDNKVSKDTEQSRKTDKKQIGNSKNRGMHIT